MSRSGTTAMSDDIRALAQAFLLAKKEFLSTGLSGNNAHQKYKYAKIEDIYGAVEGALSKNHIIIWHYARPDAGVEYLITRLVHTQTGQFIEDVRIMESEKPGNQAKGAANTYMKKYAVLSLCSIPTEDDDGEEEEKHIAQKQYEEEPTITPDQLLSLNNDLKACSNAGTLFTAIKGFNEVENLAQLKRSKFAGVKAYIEKNRK